MSEKNQRLIRTLVAAMNERRYDRVRALCSKDFVSKGLPFSGSGWDWDSSDGKHVFVKFVIPGAPCDGKLLPGDEVLAIKTGDQCYEGYDALRSNYWGQGVPGDEIQFRLRRGTEELSVVVVRGLITTYQFGLADFLSNLDFFDRSWPDHHEEIIRIVDGGEHLAVLSLMSGTNRRLSRPATWATCMIYGVRDGQIVELTGIEDSLSQLIQLGYGMASPAKKESA